MRNNLRERLDSSKDICGAFITLLDPAIVELVALAGFDFTFIDLEHNAMTLETLENHLRAAKAHDLGVLVRVPDDDPKFILRVLDIGAEGILLPHALSAESARAVVRAVRYPPIGERGFYGVARGSDYGAHALGGNRELADELNRSVVIALLIEDRAGVDSCEEMASTPGIDIVAVGPADLSASLGILGEKKPAVVGEAIERVSAACRRAGIRFGLPIEHGAYSLTAQEARAIGVRILLAGMDRSILLQGFASTRARLQDS